MSETSGDSDAHRLPEWYMPPQMIGGYVTGPTLISQSDRVVVMARQVLAFPAGVEAEVHAHARGSRTATSASAPDEVVADPQLRFRVRFSDGRAATQDDEAGLRNGRGPMLVVCGSQGSYSGDPDRREELRMTLWIWPLPPPGPVILMCSWPSAGLQEASLVLDGNAIRAAASQAQPLWPPRVT